MQKDTLSEKFILILRELNQLCIREQRKIDEAARTLYDKEKEEGKEFRSTIDLPTVR